MCRKFIILLRVGPQNNVSLKPVRSAKKVADPCPEQIPARAIVEGSRRRILVLCIYIVCNLARLLLNLALPIALRENIPQMFSCLRRSDRRERDGMVMDM